MVQARATLRETMGRPPGRKVIQVIAFRATPEMAARLEELAGDVLDGRPSTVARRLVELGLELVSKKPELLSRKSKKTEK